MPVAAVLEEDFINYVDRPLPELLTEHKANVPKFQKILRDIIFKIHGEVDRDIRNQIINQSNYITSFNTVISKINFFLKVRFYENEAGLHYRYDRLDLLINPSGIEILQYAYFIYDNCLGLRSYLIQQQTDCEKLFQESPVSLRLTKRKNKGKRIPSRESFEIIDGKEVNLRVVHARLIDEGHPFIDTRTIYDVFEAIFSGSPVINKVDWLNANALHYFIERIHGRGIKRANEGQWVRTSKCFTVNGKEITPKSIKDSDDISTSTTILLNEPIRPFL